MSKHGGMIKNNIWNKYEGLIEHWTFSKVQAH